MKLKTISSHQMREIEVRSEVEFGMSALMLMENAGRSVAEHILSINAFKLLSVIVICGPGNNGGDAAVAARHLYLAGRKVTVVICGRKSASNRSSAPSEVNLGIVRKMNLVAGQSMPLEKILRAKNKSFVLDGLFGTGLNRKLSESLNRVVDTINHSNRMVYSIDIPSGIHADTGEIMGAHIQSDYTGALAYVKQGLMLKAGSRASGKITVLPIGLPMQKVSYDY
ncbi:MAG: NAD(P)H-hydrate epimerase [Candidatus Omnitrophica bacterium]|nr:NAD(P)H-hydrate epimerase [Candidatus Omnitrophota bacterium]